MTNIDAGSQRIRRLPDKPIVGETYPNAGGIYKVDRYDAERDLAWVYRRGRLEVLRTWPRAVRCAGSGYRVAVELQHRGPVQCRRLRRKVVKRL